MEWYFYSIATEPLSAKPSSIVQNLFNRDKMDSISAVFEPKNVQGRKKVDDEMTLNDEIFFLQVRNFFIIDSFSSKNAKFCAELSLFAFFCSSLS